MIQCVKLATQNQYLYVCQVCVLAWLLFGNGDPFLAKNHLNVGGERGVNTRGCSGVAYDDSYCEKF